MKYITNQLSGPLILSDVRKHVEYDPYKRLVQVMEDSIFERSSELQNHIINGNVRDVTEERLAEMEKAKRLGIALSPYIGDTFNRNQPLAANAQQTQHGTPQASTMPKTSPIMIDAEEASRAYGASDSHLHTQHIGEDVRPNGQTGFLVSDYDDARLTARVDTGRSAYLVEEDSKAAPSTDQRFYRKSSYAPVNLDAVNPAPPMQHMYREASVTRPVANYETHSHTKENDNWGGNSALLQSRLSERGVVPQGQGHQHGNAGDDGPDPRILANKAPQFSINPLLNDTPLASEEELTEGVKLNPLATLDIKTTKKAVSPKSTKDKKPKVKKRIKKDELQISEVKITSKSKSATGAKRGRPRKPTV